MLFQFLRECYKHRLPVLSRANSRPAIYSKKSFPLYQLHCILHTLSLYFVFNLRSTYSSIGGISFYFHGISFSFLGISLTFRTISFSFHVTFPLLFHFTRTILIEHLFSPMFRMGNLCAVQ